jgi:hypothetical protein
VRNEVAAIDSIRQSVRAMDHGTGREYEEGYGFTIDDCFSSSIVN